MRECVDVIRAAQISAVSKAKICIERQGEPAVVRLATEQVIALAATPAPSQSCTEDIFERFYLAAWASAARDEDGGGGGRPGKKVSLRRGSRARP
jgi:hypothetical protein